MKNNVLSAQGSLEGIYQLSSTVNKEKSWTSKTKGLWYNSGKRIWLIGSKENIGGEIAGVYAARIRGTGPLNPDILWHYRNKGWKTDNNKDIKLSCIDKNNGVSVQSLRDSAIVESFQGEYLSYA